MNCWTPDCVRFEFAQNLARYRSRLAFAEEYVLEDVSDRIAFSPAKIGVGYGVGVIANIQKNGGDSVRYGRAGTANYLESVDEISLNFQAVFHEIRRIL